MSPLVRGASALAVVAVGVLVPVARAFTRVPPPEPAVIELAREGYIRRAGEGGRDADLERLSDAVVSAPEAAVLLHSRCVELHFSFLSSGRWFYDVEVNAGDGESDRFWMEVVDLPGGPALFRAGAPGPVLGCIDR